MAEPTTLPTWATDATYSAPGEDWDGDATTVDPGAGIRASGFEPDLLPAPWLNYVLSLWGSWLAWFRSWHRSGDEEFIYPSTKSRTRTIGAAEILPSGAGDGTCDWYLTVSSGVPRWSVLDPNARAYVPIDLPSGCTITGISALVNSSSARSSPNGWTVELWVQTESWVSPGGWGAVQKGTTKEGGLSSGAAVITLDAFTAYEIVAGAHVHVIVKAPATSIALGDQLFAVRVSFTDGGPRNA